MRSGRLSRNIVTLQTATESRDQVGGVVHTWTTLGCPRLRATVTSNAGDEKRSTDQEHATIVYKVRFRGDSQTRRIGPKDRVIYHHMDGDRVLDVDDVNDVMEIGREIVLTCTYRRGQMGIAT